MTEITSIPESFRDSVACSLFELMKENRDFFALFYLKSREEAVCCDSNDIIEFDFEFVKLIRGDKSFTVFKFDDVTCVSVTVGKEIAEEGG